MFSKGDLVKVLSNSVSEITMTNKTLAVGNLGNRMARHVDTGLIELRLTYGNPKKATDGPIGIVTSVIRNALFLVKVNDEQELVCFPDELELVYAT